MTKKKQRRQPDSKRTAGVDRHIKPRLAFHLDEALLAAMEKYIEATRPRPTSTSVLVTSLEQFLEREGFWPPGA